MIARAQVLLAEYGQFDPPFDPEKMAGLQRIIRIDRADIIFDACLLPTDGGFRVEVCKFHPRGRQTFSIGHEIGHTFLIELEPSLGGARREVGIPASSTANSELVERLCNKAATELIWPTHAFLRDAWENGASLAVVLTLASRYKASVTATARRFAEVGPWRCAFILWETETRGSTLIPKTIFRSDDAPLTARERISARKNSQFYAALQCNHIVKGREALGPSEYPLYTESMRLGQGVISMVIFEPSPETLAARPPKRAQPFLFRL